MKTTIRTKYQRARCAAVIANQLRRHQDPKVAAAAAAISSVLAAPIEIAGVDVARCCVAYPEFIEPLLQEKLLAEGNL